MYHPSPPYTLVVLLTTRDVVIANDAMGHCKYYAPRRKEQQNNELFLC